MLLLQNKELDAERRERRSKGQQQQQQLQEKLEHAETTIHQQKLDVSMLLVSWGCTCGTPGMLCGKC